MSQQVPGAWATLHSKASALRLRRIPATLALVLAAALAVACSAESETAPPAANDAPSPADAAAATPKKKAVAKLAGAVPELRYYMLDESCPYCRDIVVVLNGRETPKDGDEEPLAKTYADRVTIVVKPAFDENYDPDPEIEAFGFGMSAHGAVGLLPSGEIAFSMPGHHYGRKELAGAIEKMLAK